MGVVSLKRINNIGITYKKGSIKEHHYETIIEKVLGIPENEIEGVDNRGDMRFLFEVSTKERYDHICENFTGRDITIEDGCVIQIDDISSYSTRIKISKVPFQVTNKMLSDALTKYGKVEKCINYFCEFGKYKDFKKTGFRIVWMHLKCQIPQALLINQTQTTIYVQYENQEFTCNKCGNVGHRANICNELSGNYINIINVKVNDGSSSDKESDSEDEADDEEEMDTESETETHEESSKTTKIHYCPKCEYNCTGKEILEDHMKTHTEEGISSCTENRYKKDNTQKPNKHMQEHTGEKLFKCQLCEIEFNEETELRKHIQFHKDEKLFNCTECEYACKNEDVLLIHLTSHNIHICKICEYKGESAEKLAYHAKEHSKEKHKCSKCDYLGKSKSDLNMHMDSHTEEKTTGKAYSSVVKTPEKTKNSKRKELSLSPEESNNTKKALRKNKSTRNS